VPDDDDSAMSIDGIVDAGLGVIHRISTAVVERA
jgi:hypothetical protein